MKTIKNTLIPTTLLLSFMATLTAGCVTTSEEALKAIEGKTVDDFYIVDCSLPGKVMQLGTTITYLTPKRALKTNALSCRLRGGEYVAYDQADFATALKTWLPQAKEGNAEAQVYVGEIYEKGLGTPADYNAAAQWYQRAAGQGSSRAQINLGYLYETGLGVEQDITAAMNLYRQASGFSDGGLEYVSSLEFSRRESAEAERVILREAVSDLKNQLNQVEQQYQSYKSDLALGQTELASLRAQVSAQRTAFMQADNSASEASGEIRSTLKKIDALDTRLDNLENDRSRLSRELDTQQTTTNNEREKYLSLTRTQRDKEKSLQQVQSDIRERLNGGDSNSDAGQKALLFAQRKAKSLQKEIARLETSNAGKSQQVQDRIKNLESAEKALLQALDRVNQSIADARQEKQDLEAQYRVDQLNMGVQLIKDDTRATTDLEVKKLRNELKRLSDIISSKELEQIETTEKMARLQSSAQSTERESTALQSALENANQQLNAARMEQARISSQLLKGQLASRSNEQSLSLQLTVLEAQLQEKESALQTKQQYLSQLEGEVSQARSKMVDTRTDQVVQIVSTGLNIEIVEPPLALARGIPSINIGGSESDELIGKIQPVADVISFKVNGARYPLNPRGVFQIEMFQSTEAVELVAVDSAGERTRLLLNVAKNGADSGNLERHSSNTQVTAELQKIDYGNYHALIIGNQNYQHLTDLQSPERDARAIDALLREQYGFNTRLLLNGSQLDIVSALNKLRQTLTPQDNLLIYYSGLGQIDAQSRRGYWLPTDATADETTHWLSNAAISNFLDTIEAKHIMVIADSCFSGTMSKTSVARASPNDGPEARARWLKVVSQSRMRAVLSSGAVKPQRNSAGDAVNSVFADSLIRSLGANDGVMAGSALFKAVNLGITTGSSAGPLTDPSTGQVTEDMAATPLYAPIRHTGHEAGEFLFVANSI